MHAFPILVRHCCDRTDELEDTANRLLVLPGFRPHHHLQRPLAFAFNAHHKASTSLAIPSCNASALVPLHYLRSCVDVGPASKLGINIHAYAPTLHRRKVQTSLVPALPQSRVERETHLKRFLSIFSPFLTSKRASTFFTPVPLQPSQTLVCSIHLLPTPV